MHLLQNVQIKIGSQTVGVGSSAAIHFYTGNNPDVTLIDGTEETIYDTKKKIERKSIMKKTLCYVLGYILLCSSYFFLLSIVLLVFMRTGKYILSNVIIPIFSILHIFLCIIYGLYWRKKTFLMRKYVIIALAIGYCIFRFVKTGFAFNIYHTYLQIFPLIYAVLIVCILKIHNKR